ncbi:histone-lysine N-methyltransferase SETMAR-like [Diadema antillarum]|uniref:histone-lysine N-methyltransferase SETMAR-like n=1 Tax=Diadema antillarum TaxID=105358 RepID=UPI003A85E0E5
MDPREIQYSGCSCSHPTCEHSSCECINRFGPNYTSSGQLLRKDGEERSIKWDVKNGDCEMYRISMPIFECNASCLCGERCENRLVQNGIRHKMEVFRTKSKGWGLRTLETIPKDSFVCEYAGEVLTTEEARERVGAMQAGDMNFVFVLNETFGGGQASRTCIDARYKGNIARFINHSCEPNLYLVAVRIHNEIPHVAMFALREISPGQELTYHYCGCSENPQSSREMAANEGGLSWTPCMCESPSCKKFLPRDVSI